MRLVPAIYEHAARLIDRSPWDVSRDAALLAEAHMRAYAHYRHAPVVVGIDVYNVEAEAYGAVVARPEGMHVPVIPQPPFDTLREVLDALPHTDPATGGRFPLVLEAAQAVAAQCPQAEVRVPLSGPVSIAAGLLGLETLVMESMEDPDLFAELLSRLAEDQVCRARAIAECGLGIMFFDSAAAPPMFSPSQFRNVIAPVLQRMLHDVQAVTGRPSPIIIGGDMACVASCLLDFATDAVICPAETDQAAFLAALRSRPDIEVRINLPAGLIAAPSPDDLFAALDRAAALAATHPNACIGTSVIPYATPLEHLARAQAYLAQEISTVRTSTPPR